MWGQIWSLSALDPKHSLTSNYWQAYPLLCTNEVMWSDPTGNTALHRDPNQKILQTRVENKDEECCATLGKGAGQYSRVNRLVNSAFINNFDLFASYCVLSQQASRGAVAGGTAWNRPSTFTAMTQSHTETQCMSLIQWDWVERKSSVFSRIASQSRQKTGERKVKLVVLDYHGQSFDSSVFLGTVTSLGKRCLPQKLAEQWEISVYECHSCYGKISCTLAPRQLTHTFSALGNRNMLQV